MREDFPEVEYKVELRLDGKLIGNCRKIAEGLVWAKRKTNVGVDSISFTVNDFIFSEWCEERGLTLTDVIRPLALDCRIVRNGIAMVGGYLATMPAYQPTGHSASLSLQFDGYLNYLDGVYLPPTDEGPVTKPMNELLDSWIAGADHIAHAAGKAFGFSFRKQVGVTTVVSETYDSLKSIKSYITDRCDNTTGAKEFEVYFAPDRAYSIIEDTAFGLDRSKTYVIQYPTQLNAPSATSLSAGEINGFASAIVATGGDTEPKPYYEGYDEEAVKRYGYRETTLERSDVTQSATLAELAKTELAKRSSLTWQPEIQLSGRHVTPEPPFDLQFPTTPKPPQPNATNPIWIGDKIAIHNSIDLTGMSSGIFRVNELEVSVDATGAETIKPTISREGSSVGNLTFAQEFLRLQNELRYLKTYVKPKQ